MYEPYGDRREDMMPQSATPQLVQLDAYGQGVAFCPQCGAGNRVSPNPGPHVHTFKMITCPCGQHFPVLFNSRKFRRQTVSLPGTYTLPGEEIERQMTVENLSLAGAHFRPLLPNTLHIGDEVTLCFYLDDPPHTKLDLRATVRWMTRHAIGAEFCDLQGVETALGVYLQSRL